MVGWNEGFLFVYLKPIEAASFSIAERKGLKNVNFESFRLVYGDFEA